jgi:hypothetical protein
LIQKEQHCESPQTATVFTMIFWASEVIDTIDELLHLQALYHVQGIHSTKSTQADWKEAN